MTRVADGMFAASGGDGAGGREGAGSGGVQTMDDTSDN